MTECKHPETRRGRNIPRRYGSYRSQICLACGSFRTLTHHDEVVGAWQPAAQYDAATAPDEEL